MRRSVRGVPPPPSGRGSSYPARHSPRLLVPCPDHPPGELAGHGVGGPGLFPCVGDIGLRLLGFLLRGARPGAKVPSDVPAIPEARIARRDRRLMVGSWNMAFSSFRMGCRAVRPTRTAVAVDCGEQRHQGISVPGDSQQDLGSTAASVAFNGRGTRTDACRIGMMWPVCMLLCRCSAKPT